MPLKGRCTTKGIHCYGLSDGLLYICNQGKENKIWNYNNRFVKKAYSSSGTFAEDMMQQAGRRLPYAR